MGGAGGAVETPEPGPCVRRPFPRWLVVLTCFANLDSSFSTFLLPQHSSLPIFCSIKSFACIAHLPLSCRLKLHPAPDHFYTRDEGLTALSSTPPLIAWLASSMHRHQNRGNAGSPPSGTKVQTKLFAQFTIKDSYNIRFTFDTTTFTLSCLELDLDLDLSGGRIVQVPAVSTAICAAIRWTCLYCRHDMT